MKFESKCQCHSFNKIAFENVVCKIATTLFGSPWSIRADSRFAPSPWETALLCNDVSHWLGTSLESVQKYHVISVCDFCKQVFVYMYIIFVSELLLSCLGEVYGSISFRKTYILHCYYFCYFHCNSADFVDSTFMTFAYHMYIPVWSIL